MMRITAYVILASLCGAAAFALIAPALAAFLAGLAVAASLFLLIAGLFKGLYAAAHALACKVFPDEIDARNRA